MGATPLGWIGTACHLDPGVLAQRLTPILTAASASDRVAHTLRVYERHARREDTRERETCVPKSLLTFIQRLPDGGSVLDLGTGAHARDAIFMAEQNGPWRAAHMEATIEVHGEYHMPKDPLKSMNVVGIEGARAVWELANQRVQTHSWTTIPKGRHPVLPLPILRLDMHDLSSFSKDRFDGVWAHRSLLVHTPHELVRQSIQGVARILRTGGLFAVTYSPKTTSSPHIVETLRPFGDHDLVCVAHHEQVMIETIAYYAGLELEHVEHTSCDSPDTVTGMHEYLTEFFRKT